MNSVLCVPLNTTPDQAARLMALQQAFAEVCNAIAPTVQQTRCWNRVALHHLVYHSLRERFPQMGSQMVCNAIYSVSRTCRLVLQHPASPFNVAKRQGSPLPLLSFSPTAPVYFDRHTLSLKDGRLSMYTLDGRMRFQLDLKPEDMARFRTEKLQEIVLSRLPAGFQLAFTFSMEDQIGKAPTVDAQTTTPSSGEFPEYLIVIPATIPVAKELGEVA